RKQVALFVEKRQLWWARRLEECGAGWHHEDGGESEARARGAPAAGSSLPADREPHHLPQVGLPRGPLVTAHTAALLQNSAKVIEGLQLDGHTVSEQGACLTTGMTLRGANGTIRAAETTRNILTTGGHSREGGAVNAVGGAQDDAATTAFASSVFAHLTRHALRNEEPRAVSPRELDQPLSDLEALDVNENWRQASRLVEEQLAPGRGLYTDPLGEVRRVPSARESSGPLLAHDHYARLASSAMQPTTLHSSGVPVFADAGGTTSAEVGKHGEGGRGGSSQRVDAASPYWEEGGESHIEKRLGL
ncbi:hypothetical protein CYMTET_18627, partial [Cymbomonas tetramitiformis]